MPRYAFDGEKIPSNELPHLIKMPPGVDGGFKRSALIVGSQGAGKTVLLRRAKAIAKRGAVYVNLYTALNSLSEELGKGGLHLEYDEAVQRSLRNKAAALILGAILGSLKDDGLPFLPELLRPALPRDTAPPQLSSYDEFQYLVARTRLLHFVDHSNTDVLLGSLARASDKMGDIGCAVTICLDRADSVPWPATYPLFSLLDQSQSCLTLVATRPGLSAGIAQVPTRAALQYDLIQLGTSPYDNDWLEFTRSAVSDYYQDDERSLVPDDLVEQAVRVGRESLRLVLQLLHFSATTDDWQDAFSARARLSQRLLETAACTTLAAVDVDFRHYANLARRELHDGGTVCPVFLSITGADDTLFVDRKTRNFVELALRESILVMPPGEIWYPGATPLQLEIPPIFTRTFGTTL